MHTSQANIEKLVKDLGVLKDRVTELAERLNKLTGEPAGEDVKAILQNIKDNKDVAKELAKLQKYINDQKELDCTMLFNELCYSENKYAAAKMLFDSGKCDVNKKVTEIIFQPEFVDLLLKNKPYARGFTQLESHDKEIDPFKATSKDDKLRVMFLEQKALKISDAKRSDLKEALEKRKKTRKKKIQENKDVLFTAIRDGDLNLVREALENKADPNATTPADVPLIWFALNKAIGDKNFEILQKYNECMVDMNNIFDKKPYLWEEVLIQDKKYLMIIELLILHGADCKEKYEGKTFYDAVKRWKITRLQNLIDAQVK